MTYPERRQWQSQRVQGWERMQPTDLWATSECRTHGPASKAPLPVRPSRDPERQSATGGAHGAAAGGQAAPDDLAEGPAPFYRRLRRSPPRCTSGYTARQLSGCALRVRTPCAPPSPLSGPLPGSAGWGPSARAPRRRAPAPAATRSGPPPARDKPSMAVRHTHNAFMPGQDVVEDEHPSSPRMHADVMQPDSHLAAPGGEGAAEPDRLADGVSTVWAAEQQVSDSELQLIKARTMYQVWIWREGSLARSVLQRS